MAAYWITGDTLATLRAMPAGSVDVVITSPPFLALRSYLPADDPAKAMEIGQEGSPGAFLDVLLDITEELRRVLAPHGSICVELGDSFSGSGGAGGDYTDTGWRAGQERFGGSASRARTREAQWSIAQATWLAGIIDAEGSIMVRRQESARLSPNFSAAVRVTMMDRQICDRAAEVTGVGSVSQDKRGAYSWGVTGQQARYVLSNIWPHLLIKQRQALAAIELQRHVEEKRRRGKYDQLEPDDIAFREMIREYVMGLNARGEDRGVYVPTWNPPRPRRIEHPTVGASDGWPLDKSLAMVPELYRIALAYGVNPLTGRTTPRWRVRNTVRWVRPNPPVGALGDKFRPATSDMVIATMAKDRFFDLDAVRGTVVDDGYERTTNGPKHDGRDGEPRYDKRIASNPAGAPPLDWWEIPTHPYKGSHYATFPPALVEKPIKAMCPQRVCTVCGKPSERIVEPTEEYAEAISQMMETVKPETSGSNRSNPNKLNRGQAGVKAGVASVPYGKKTIGWSDCGHDAWRNGRVLDIFGGSGTTLAVATGHGRDAIGIDLDQRNVDLARDRIGPMFFHEVTVDELAAMFGSREAA